MALNKIENNVRSYVKSIVRFIVKYRATISLAGVIGVIVILIYGRKSDLIGFPFDAGVWGGVSDWVMVAVTFVTAIYLIKTFREQQVITRIEAYRYKQEIMPRFVLEQHIFSEDITEDNHYKVVCDFDFINNDRGFDLSGL